MSNETDKEGDPLGQDGSHKSGESIQGEVPVLFEQTQGATFVALYRKGPSEESYERLITD
jgi:hypothetical protein